MTHLNSSEDRNLPNDSPAYWNEDTLSQRWKEFVENRAGQPDITIPVKRLQLQLERLTEYMEVTRGWSKMNGASRGHAWKRLLEASEKAAKEVLPMCVRCGECCRKGSPTLLEEDLELLQEGRIPWEQLFTLREGEPAYSPFEEKPLLLPSECIKIREKAGAKGCIFFDDQRGQCGIYSHRPVQCRAQACWDPKPARQLSKLPYLTRSTIFADVELLRDILAEHDQRCAFRNLNQAFAELSSGTDTGVEKVLELMAFEDHFRHFFAERLNIPEDTLELVFGRSFAELAPLFGFQVLTEPDGSRCLVPEIPATE